MVFGQQRTFAGAASRAAFVVFGVVVAEHVQDTVHDEQRDLVVVSAGVIGELFGGDGLAQTTTSPSRTGMSGPGIGSSSSGNDSTSVGPTLPMCSAFSSAMSSRRRR